MTHLIDTTKLEVAAEVLFVKSLHSGVEETAEERTLHLFYDLRTSLLRIVFRHDGAELVVVEVVFLAQLVR